MKTFPLLGLLFVLLAEASPIVTPNVDTSSHCGQWDTVTAGNYELILDQWGASGATSGTDCAQITSLNGNTIAWKTTSSWVGGTGVKSFTNIQLNEGINQQLSAISKMPAVWDWSISSTNIVADVAFDLFTSNSAGGSNVNEIMIWLANLNAGPISSQYGSNGQPVPAASDISLGGHTWNLYSGSNGANNVFSFLPSSGTITNFNTDIFPFFQYLIQHEGSAVTSSQYLVTAQAGTEATSGNATLTTTAYSLSIE